jgi:hypothetical protein
MGGSTLDQRRYVRNKLLEFFNIKKYLCLTLKIEHQFGWIQESRLKAFLILNIYDIGPLTASIQGAQCERVIMGIASYYYRD